MEKPTNIDAGTDSTDVTSQTDSEALPLTLTLIEQGASLTEEEVDHIVNVSS